jgi:methionyl aminopeptidase
MIEILNPTLLARARDTGTLVADILQTLKSRSAVGTNLLDIDRWAKTMIVEAGALSCYVDYEPSFGRGPFGHYICTSVNDAVLHGLPHDYVLQDGDLLSVDFAANVAGWVADSAYSLVVGTARVEDVALIATTQRALAAGIAAAQPGNRVGDISHAIASVAREAGLRINTEFGGHGVGRTMHGDPHVPNDGRPGRGYPLKPGLVIAIEPWFLHTTDKIKFDADGWTLRSVDGSRGAHMEHTVAVTESGPLVLTSREPEPVLRGGSTAA